MDPGTRTYLTKMARWSALPVIVLGGVIAWLALDTGFRRSPDATPEMPQEAFGQRVRDYLLNHPEVIVEAIQRLEARRRTAEEGEAQVVLKSRADEIFRDPASPVGGDPQGDVTLVEFFDYNCGYCRQVAPVVSEAEKSDARLRIVYKEFPILGPNSVFAARAALAAHRQGKYTALHNALMKVRGTVDETGVMRIAAEIGLDVERLKADMNDAGIQAAIDRNLKLARALRITGTPGFVVGTRILRGATDLETLRKLIDEARRTKP